jgi:hypothetical protein
MCRPPITSPFLTSNQLSSCFRPSTLLLYAINTPKLYSQSGRFVACLLPPYDWCCIKIFLFCKTCCFSGWHTAQWAKWAWFSDSKQGEFQTGSPGMSAILACGASVSLSDNRICIFLGDSLFSSTIKEIIFFFQ